MSNLYEHYKTELHPKLQKDLAISNPMEVPKITKVTLNMGVGEAITDRKVMDAAVSDMTATGRFTVVGNSLIAQTSGLDAIGGIIYRGATTITQTSGFNAVGGLKWEDIIVPDDTWTDQIVASATWTDQSNPSTNWTELDKQEAA